jgi:hypothetical protein
MQRRKQSNVKRKTELCKRENKATQRGKPDNAKKKS